MSNKRDTYWLYFLAVVILVAIADSWVALGLAGPVLLGITLVYIVNRAKVIGADETFWQNKRKGY